MPAQRKVAIVTGASRGIGKGIALNLARKGFDLALCARTVRKGEFHEYTPTVKKKSDGGPLPGSLEETAAAVQALGVRALPVKMDLLERREREEGVAQVLKAFGRIDVLVNNGRYIGPGHMDLLLDTPIEFLERQVMANSIAPIHLIQLVAPAMIKQGGGIVINITSRSGTWETAALPGQGGWGLGYSISKAAIIRAGPGIAKELKQYNIAVINVSPGFVATERMVFMGEFGFDVNKGLSVDVPGAACAFLATHPHPMLFSDREVEAPDFAVAHGLVDPETLPVANGPKTWGLPKA